MNKKIPFFKYQGAGNDFILIDNRTNNYLNRKDTQTINHLCDRRFGIGADGLILLNEKEGYDFEMVYFNADGRESSMCGNGGRCIVAFAAFLGIIEDRCSFLAIDGPHDGVLRADGWVNLKMKNVEQVEVGEGYYFMDTGSPHYVRFQKSLDEFDTVKEGKAIRYSSRFKEEGTNVNFVEVLTNGIAVATYERGVEDETLACGTGVTACALAYSLQYPQKGETSIPIQAKGGKLEVRFSKKDASFSNIWLCGPAEQVFKGEIELVE